MDQVSAKVKEVLENGLEGCEAFLDTEPNGRVTGHVVAREFDDLSYEDRRKCIRAVIEEAVTSGRLTREDALSVSTLLTYTPDEWAVTLPDD
jgi:acid stress-induced BolA-like protein IbaG/YrbA